ncbi:hypothetical protein SELMODRAFT_410865 [Selaginella moellendorffii]|uniref:F-box domain-containing protein n=1 Tax=Selaginella moellendorffii TaxID=88036 RepID=D8RG43_SELML|nr:hypothetical protein SELMODRAFT_410865 [Selaginella moellendorffii]
MIAELLGHDLLVRILLLLAWDSLLPALGVCKEWRSIIRSPEFSAARAQQPGEYYVLLTAYNGNWERIPRPQQICVWTPKSRTVSPLPPWMKIPLPPGSFDIVASSNGLVLVRLPSWADDASPGVELVVGNPATNEWVRIPRLAPQVHSGRVYSMTADPATGEFEVVDAFNYHFYESRSRAWTRVADYPEGFLFDTARCIIVPHKEPLLNDPTLVCVPFVWEHKGERYVAGAFRIKEGDPQCRVWSMEEPMDMAGKREASCVLDVEKAWSSGHCREVASSFLDLTDVYWDDFLTLECQAEGNLLCLAGQCRDRYDDSHKLGDCGGEPLPPAVYDLDRGEWFYIRGKSETVGQYSVGEVVHYRRAVVYRPLLVRPSGGGALGLDPEEEKRLAGHKRTGEEQHLEIPKIRQRRIKAIGFWDEVRKGPSLKSREVWITLENHLEAQGSCPPIRLLRVEIDSRRALTRENYAASNGSDWLGTMLDSN